MSLATPQSDRELITLAVPVLNEESYIASCLESLLTQGDTHRLEILVLDGGSQDRTAAIVREMAARHPEIRLVENPARLQSAAVNLAARIAARESRILLRADAHAWYPPGFVTGGPNKNYSGDARPPGGSPHPNRAYRDWNDQSAWTARTWEITESSIGYQGPYVALVAAFAGARGE